ncbi:MAG: pyridinium-3,5-biscarboxylic acid mononucleotide synthase, partial [Gaiellales bacterium]|nr:pyridinium-3,5-biscarboxylic acid mononucleotide synthase [Gaiellales bacterium]
MSFADLGFARVDLDRDARQVAPEAVLAEGKTPSEIEAIVRALRDGGASSVLVTRADDDARAAVRRVDAGALEHVRARCAWI